MVGRSYMEDMSNMEGMSNMVGRSYMEDMSNMEGMGNTESMGNREVFQEVFSLILANIIGN